MRRLFSFLLGTITGALFGAAIAILIAPSSGEELQARARERVTNLRDEIQDAYQARVSQLEAELESMRKQPEPETEAES
jgi:gas vesicle protein